MQNTYKINLHLIKFHLRVTEILLENYGCNEDLRKPLSL